MSHVADRLVAVLDANVLFPFRTRDALLRFAEAGLFQPRWTRTILDEWRRNLLALKPQLASSVAAQMDAMARAFPEALVRGHEPLIGTLLLPDPDDRHVLAAAVRAGATHIATENLRDFPAEALKGLGIDPVGADDFLAAIFEFHPAEAVAALRTMRRAYRRPAMDAAEFILDLRTSGLPRLATLAEAYGDAL